MILYRECGIKHTNYESDMALFPLPVGRIALAIMLVLGIVAPFLLDIYWLEAILIPLLIFSLATMGLNIMMGCCGQISLGHAIFMGVGGYVAITLHVLYHVPFILSVVLGGVAATLAGLLFGIPSSRVKGLYLALSTLAAQFFFPWVIRRIIPLLYPPGYQFLGGGDSIYPGTIQILGWVVDTPIEKYYVSLGFLIPLTFFAANLMRSRIGRAWIAIRDHDVAARIIGINIFRYKLLAFAIGSFYAGIAGALLVYFFYGVAHIGEFDFILSLKLAGAVIIGGMGTIIGNFFGTALILFIPILLNRLLVSLGAATGNLLLMNPGVISGIEGILLGLIIILFLVFEPRGLAKIYYDIRDYLRLWPFPYKPH